MGRAFESFRVSFHLCNFLLITFSSHNSKIFYKFSVSHQYNLPTHHYRPNHSQHLANQATKHESHDRHSVGQISENTEYDNNDRKYSISGECCESIKFLSHSICCCTLSECVVQLFISLYLCTHLNSFIRRKLPFLMLKCLSYSN